MIIKYKETKAYKLRQAREVGSALMTLAYPPEDMDTLDEKEMRFDLNTTTAYKLRNWYDDQLLEWFERVNLIMTKYKKLDPRTKDIKRIMSGMSIHDVCGLFLDEYEKFGEVRR
jgi:hypothetical protein